MAFRGLIVAKFWHLSRKYEILPLTLSCRTKCADTPRKCRLHFFATGESFFGSIFPMPIDLDIQNLDDATRALCSVQSYLDEGVSPHRLRGEMVSIVRMMSACSPEWIGYTWSRGSTRNEIYTALSMAVQFSKKTGAMPENKLRLSHMQQESEVFV